MEKDSFTEIRETMKAAVVAGRNFYKTYTNPVRLAGLLLLLILITVLFDSSLSIGRHMSKFAFTKNLSPSGSHWLGTDQLGRDNLLLSLTTSLNSFSISLLTSLLTLVAGLFLGIVWALGKRRVVRFLDLFFRLHNAVPYVFLIVFMFTVLINFVELNNVRAGYFIQILAQSVAISIFLVSSSARFYRDFFQKEWAKSYIFTLRNNGMPRGRLIKKILRTNYSELITLQFVYLLSMAFLIHVGVDYLIELGLGEMMANPVLTAGNIMAENRECFMLGTNYWAIIPLIFLTLFQILLFRLFLLRKRKL